MPNNTLLPNFISRLDWSMSWHTVPPMYDLATWKKFCMTLYGFNAIWWTLCSQTARLPESLSGLQKLCSQKEVQSEVKTVVWFPRSRCWTLCFVQKLSESLQERRRSVGLRGIAGTLVNHWNWNRAKWTFESHKKSSVPKSVTCSH